MFSVGDYVDRIMATEHDDKRHFEMLASTINTDPDTMKAGINWESIRARPLDAQQVVGLAEEMLAYAHEEMQLEPEALYDKRRAEWHAFLKDMRRIAAEMGVEVPVEMIDQPFTPTESIVKADMVEVTTEGTVVLTEQGLATAKQFEDESPDDARVLREIVGQISEDEIREGL